MFEARRSMTRSRSAFSMLGLIYHSIVREIRKDHRNAVVGLIMNMMQTVIFATAFYFMFTILGLKGTAIRGDFMLYIMSGIFLFLTHTKAMGAVLKAEGPASALMKHAPMNTIIAISSAAIASLYIQLLSITVVLYLYHVILSPITIHTRPALSAWCFPRGFRVLQSGLSSGHSNHGFPDLSQSCRRFMPVPI